MAAEPKRSFKRTVASTVEGRSPGFLLSSLALAMVISLLAGLGIGIQVGDHNKTDDQAQGREARPPPTQSAASATRDRASRPAQGRRGADPTTLPVVHDVDDRGRHARSPNRCHRGRPGSRLAAAPRPAG